MSAAASVGAPPTWVLSNHDVTRTVTAIRVRSRRSGGDGLGAGAVGGRRMPTTNWAGGGREPVLLQLALPGTAYIYQGEELGLEDRTFPTSGPDLGQSGFTDVGRDGCRGLPWSGSTPPYGFSPSATTTWLPQPGTLGVPTGGGSGRRS